MNFITWCLILIAIVIIVIVLVKSSYKFETFFAETASVTPVTSNNLNLQTTIDQLNGVLNNPNVANYKYIESISSIPENNSLVLYATTFSDKTNYNNEVDVYVPAAQKWNNFVSDNQAFFIITSKLLPSSIKTPNGLPMNSVRLEGIHSDEINKVDYILGSFTATFYLRFNNLNFDSSGVIELFSISLESPNYVKLTIEKSSVNPMEVLLYAQTGDSLKTGCVINVATLTSSSAPTAISMVFTKVSPSVGNIQLYINNVVSHVSGEYTLNSQLILGNSRITINRFANLDATLHAFMYFNSALTLTSHNSLITYFEQQKSTVPSMVSLIQNITTEKIGIIKTLVSDQTLTQQNLKEKLQKCIEESKGSDVSVEPEFKYKITANGNLPATTDYLNVNNRPNVETLTPAAAPIKMYL